MSVRRSPILLLIASLAPAAQAQFQFEFDFSYDTSGFFNDAGRRETLYEAGRVFTDRFQDNLSSISPGPVPGAGWSNTWTAISFNPGGGADIQILDMQLPANVVKVYAGGQNLPDGVLGFGGPGGFTSSGTSEFNSSVRGRGQSGANFSEAHLRTDFSPWGGSITFDAGSDWNFSLTNNLGAGQADFYSIAVHELAHLLGSGPADSFNNLIQFGLFQGPKSKALNGGQSLPLHQDDHGDFGHWADGTMSVLGTTPQETAMDPIIQLGTRKYFTQLDFAGMDDLGWELPILGDITLDGRVDIDDFVLLDQGFHGNLPGYRNGDLSGNGVIGLEDYAILNEGYFLANGQMGAFAPTVPEPAGGVAVLGFVATALLRRRR